MVTQYHSHGSPPLSFSCVLELGDLGYFCVIRYRVAECVRRSTLTFR